MKEGQEVFLVRHLATEYNKAGVFMGRSFDLPIDETEIEKFARVLGKIDWKVGPETPCFSSPSLRCLQTLKILKSEMGVKGRTIVNEAFAETDYGLFEGKNAKQIRELFPEELDILMERTAEVRFPDGESLIEVQERAYGGLMKLIDDHPGEASLVVCSHVDVIKLLLFKVLEVSIDKKRYLHVYNGSVSCLEVTPEGAIKVKFINWH